MILYSGSEGSFRGLEEIRRRNMGIMATASGYRPPKPDIRWALDNGAFALYGDFQPFDLKRFERVLRRVPADHRPDFAIVPDIVAGGLPSLVFSLSCLRWLPHGWPWYLAVQDGMEADHIIPHVNEVEGLFVGGSESWKVKTGEEWVRFAHARGLKAHIGRAGTPEKIMWAERIGADSVDSMSWARNDSYHHIDTARQQQSLTAPEG